MNLDLESPDPQRSPGRTFPTIRPVPVPRSPTTETKHSATSTATSVNIDEHPRRSKTWKPSGLKPRFLVPLALLSALLLASLIIISTINHKNNSLIQVDSPDLITTAQSFAYNYLLMIIAVLYSFFWQIVDSDARRFEPFPDLSRAEGVRGDELFFEYAYKNAFAVPFLALRRKHSGVALASFAYLLSTILLGSLASSLMGVKSVTISEIVNVST
jgi:hypothetical protein